MTSQSLLLILLAVVVAISLAVYQYIYRTKLTRKLSLILGALRFLSILGILLLLINPQITKKTYRTEKTNLVVLTDYSSSVATSSDTIRSVLRQFAENSALSDRFQIKSYGFGGQLETTAQSLSNLPSDSLFTKQNTNISQALSAIDEAYTPKQTAIVLITDGNENLGRNYEFFGSRRGAPIYSIAVGDTTVYDDIAISQVNINRFAFLKNKFPVEVYLTYKGTANINKKLRISINGRSVLSKDLQFSANKNSMTVNALIEASSVGFKTIKVAIETLANERNKANNTQNLAVEVIDERTNVVIISALLHPDLGAFKKAIESNKQRSVSIMKPSIDLKELKDADLFILYQPTRAFQNVYDFIDEKEANTFTITGTQTDWNFLNSVQNDFSKNSYNQSEEIFAVESSGFNLFNVGDFSVENFPPLAANLGEIKLKDQRNILLTQQIKGVSLNQPLLAISSSKSRKAAMLFGENSWKWRLQSFRTQSNFKNFDELIGKLVLYLSTKTSKQRLSISYEPVYRGSNQAKLSATYFDEAFVFDANAELSIRLKERLSNKSSNMPLLLKNRYYQADLSTLLPGDYDFTVEVNADNLKKSGSFQILDFEVEKQLTTTDATKLNRLSRESGGLAYFPDQTQKLIEALLSQDRFLPTQKSEQNTVSLIDLKWLLALIVIALTAEWFIRKYNGLV